MEKLRKRFSRIILINFIFLYSISLYSKDIEVSILNATFNRSVTVPTVQLLQLSNGMQVIQTKKNVYNKTTFLDIPYIEAPYLLQAKYQGVLYNTVVPPFSNTVKKESFGIKVYERSSKFSSRINLATLYSFTYVKNQLQVDIYYNFLNNTNYTFSEKELGIYVYVPDTAKNILASVSVGTSTNTNIQWLKIVPKKIDNLADSYYNYILPYAIKPGERTYVLKYTMEYRGEPIEFDISSVYLSSKNQKVKFLKRPDDLNISISNSAYVFQSQQDENAQFLYYEFPIFQKKMQLSISGGTPVSKDILNDSSTIFLTTLFPYSIKFLFFIFFLMLLLFIIWILEKKYSALRPILLRSSIRKQYQMEYLKKVKPSHYKLSKLETKIKNLQENIEYIQKK